MDVLSFSACSARGPPHPTIGDDAAHPVLGPVHLRAVALIHSGGECRWIVTNPLSNIAHLAMEIRRMLDARNRRRSSSRLGRKLRRASQEPAYVVAALIIVAGLITVIRMT